MKNDTGELTLTNVYARRKETTDIFEKECKHIEGFLKQAFAKEKNGIEVALSHMLNAKDDVNLLFARLLVLNTTRMVGVLLQLRSNGEVVQLTYHFGEPKRRADDLIRSRIFDDDRAAATIISGSAKIELKELYERPTEVVAFADERKKSVA